MIITIPLDYPRNLIDYTHKPIIDEASGTPIGVILGESNLVYGLRCSIYDRRFDLSNLDFENYYFEYVGSDDEWSLDAVYIKNISK